MNWYPTFVISLIRRQDRRQRVANVMREAGLDFTFFDAVDWQQISQEEAKVWLDGYSASGTKKSKLGQYGCLHSHAKLLRSLVGIDAPAVCIFEDDVVIPVDFIQCMEYWMPFVPQDWTVLRLGGIQLKKPPMVNAAVARDIGRLTTTHAQLVRATAISSLADFYEQSVMAVDRALAQYAIESGTVYYPVPFLAIQSDSPSEMDPTGYSASCWRNSVYDGPVSWEDG